MLLGLKKHRGFTLAEVLITLGIIGVIAEMTIPTLINSTQDAEFKAAWKKEYSVVNQAFTSALSNNEIPYSDSNSTISGLKQYLKISKDCPFDARTQGCWNQTWYDYAKVQVPAGLADYPGVILMDGSFVIFSQAVFLGDPPLFTNSGTNYSMVGYVDVNGFKSPNTIGKDIFYFQIFGNKVLPMGAQGTFVTLHSDFCNSTSSAAGGGYDGAACSDDAILGTNY